MDELLLSSAPSYRCAVSFPVHPSIFIPSLSTYYYCGLFFFFLFFFPLPIIICLTLSAEQDFFCYVVLSFTVFFMIFLSVGYPCPQLLKTSDAIGVLHTTQMYVFSNYLLMQFVTSEYIRCSHRTTTAGPT